MTDFKELFNQARYGTYNSCYELRLTTHIYDIADMFEAADIIRRDKWTAEAIERIEEGLQILKDYRVALAERYAEIETAATIPVIRLRRYKGYYSDNKVYYYLEQITRYVDQPDKDKGTSYTDRIDESTKYPGTERKQALNDFEAYKKAHPGIIAELDIEKARWER